MSICPGKRKKNNSNCTSTLYRCKKCGNIGCEQNQPFDCSNQGFKAGKCLKCGVSGQKELFK